MERSDAARDREHDDGRNWFERFVEQAQQLVSRAPFFLLRVHHPRLGRQPAPVQ